MQRVTGQPVAEPLAVVSHADRDVDRGAVEMLYQRSGDVVMEGDTSPAAVKRDSHPPIPKTVEPQNLQPRSFRPAGHDPDWIECVNSLAVLIVGGPFDADDALRLRSRRDQLDHLALEMKRVSRPHR